MLKNFTHNFSDLPVCSGSDPRADSSTPDIIDAVATESSDPPRFAIVPPLVVSARTTAPTAPCCSFEPQHHPPPAAPPAPRFATESSASRVVGPIRSSRAAPPAHTPRRCAVRPPPLARIAIVAIIHSSSSIRVRIRILSSPIDRVVSGDDLTSCVLCTHDMTFDDRFHAYHTTCTCM